MGRSSIGFLNRQYMCVLKRVAWTNAFSYFIGMTAAVHGLSAHAGANSIQVDGRTQTNVSVSGNITDVTTNTIHGVNGFNSFKRFNIGNGQTVNMHLPNGTANLLNLVHDEATNINGVMNAYKDGRIGGNVFFLNPHGVAVGSDGVLNVGTLNVATPTAEFMDSMLSPGGDVNAQTVGQALNGDMPISESGYIRVKGKVNAVDSVNLHANDVNVESGSQMIAGSEAWSEFSSLVNVDGVVNASEIKLENGSISIVAENDINVAGNITVDGEQNHDAGNIDLQAGNDINISHGAQISASGHGENSAGGQIISYAQNNAVLDKNASIRANAGTSGDGGFVEFSAKQTVNIDEGELSAKATNGKNGDVLIDPAELLWTGSGKDQFTSGENYTIMATERIVLDDVVISTRDVDASDKNRANIESATSQGNSGNITIEAPKIDLKNGSALYAHANNGFTGGEVNITAKQEKSVPRLGVVSAHTEINIDNAKIHAADVNVLAQTVIDSQFAISKGDTVSSATDLAIMTAQNAGGFIATLGGAEFVVSDVSAKAYINITNGSEINSENKTDIKAETKTQAGVSSIPTPGAQVNTPIGVGALWVNNVSDAKVAIGDTASITATDLSVRSHTESTVNGQISSGYNQAQNSNFTAVAASITQADIKSTAQIAQGANIAISGDLTLAATNYGSYSNEVESITGPNGKAAAAIAYADHNTAVNATLDADVDDATNINIFAVNEVIKDEVSAFSKVGGSSLDTLIANARVKPLDKAENFFWSKLGLQVLTPDNKTSPTQQKFRIGGAIAYADSNHSALSEIGDNVDVHATDSAAVLSRVNAEQMKIAASAAAVSSSSKSPSASDTVRQAYAVGLSIADFQHEALSRLGKNSSITAPQIAVHSDTIIPIRDSLLFGSQSATDSWTRWSGLEAIVDAVDSVDNILDVFNGVSSAKSVSDESQGSIDLSGSVSILNYTDTTRAVIDSGASLNVSGSQTGPWSKSFQLRPEVKKYDPLNAGVLLSTEAEVIEQFEFNAPVSVQAKHDATLLFQSGKLLPSSGGQKSLGVALGQIGINSTTETIVREGAVIKGVTETSDAQAVGSRTWTQSGTHAAEHVSIEATSNERVIALAIGAGFGSTYGANGSYSQVKLNNSTHALVDDEASVKIKTFDISASASPVLWTIAGAINVSNDSSVGVGVAINDIVGSTQAAIADNDSWSIDADPRSSLLTVSDAKVMTSDLTITAKTGGRLATVAVAGGVANNSPKPGPLSAIKDKYEAVLDKGASLIGMQKSAVQQQNINTAGQAAEKKPGYSIGAAGSGAINVTEVETVAVVDGVDIEKIPDPVPAPPTPPAKVPTSIVIRAVGDSDMLAASGAVALNRANYVDADRTVGMAGSVSINSIGNGTVALLENSNVKNAQDVTVQALSGGEQISAALGMALDVSTGANISKSDSFVGSLSLTLAQTDDNDNTKNKTEAKVDNTSVEGENTATSRQLDVTAYNRTYIGTGAGSLSVKTGSNGTGKSIGGAVTWANIRNDVTSGVYGNSSISQMDSAQVHAYNATEIGSGAAMLGLSKAQGANSFAGSLVVNRITNNTVAEVGHSVINVTDSVDVKAADKDADATLEQLIDPDGDRSSTAKGLDYCGEGAGGAAPSGNCITAVAGTVQVGAGTNYGVSFAYNQIENNLSAKIKDSAVTVSGLANTNYINVNADSDTSILGVGFGVGVSTGKMSGAGSVTIAGIKNKVISEVGESAVGGSATSLIAPNVTISARDKSDIDSIAGQVNVTTNDLAVGMAFAYNEIENQTRSILDTANIRARERFELKALEEAQIASLSASAGVALGDATGASLSASLNFIKNTAESRLSNSTVIDGASGTNLVSVLAEDDSMIESLAGAVGVGMKAGAGAAFSLNQIANQNSAVIDGSTVDGAKTLELKALEKAVVETLAGAVGAGKSGFSGSITLNNIGQSFAGNHSNSTTAVLKDSTVLNGGSGSTVTIEGKDESDIRSIAGSVSVGTNGIAIGGAVADNNIQSTAKGQVTNSSIHNNDVLSVDGNNTSIIKSLSAAGSGATGGTFSGSSSSNRTLNETLAEISDSEVTGATSDVSVNANNSSDIESLSGSAALSTGAVAAGIAVSVNTIDDATTATVSGNKQSTAGYDVKNMQLSAVSYAVLKALGIGVGASATSGGAGSLAVNRITSDTSAFIDNGAVVTAQNNVGVVAENDNRITVAAGSAGVGLSAGGVSASFTVNTIEGDTKAYVDGTETKVTGLAKDADDLMSVNTGELSSAVDLEKQVAIDTYNNLDLKSQKAKENVAGVAINASSTQHIENISANIAGGKAFGAGVSGSVNEVSGTTQAYSNNAEINSDNVGAGESQDVQISASNVSYDNSFIGSVAVGTAAGGVGADSHVLSRTTKAYVSGGTVDAAKNVAVQALSTQGVSSLAVGGAAGGIAGAGTLSLANFSNVTEALITNVSITSSALDITAKNSNDMFLKTGAVAIGGSNAAGGAFAVGTSESTTQAIIRDNSTVYVDNAVTVDADNTTDLNHVVVSGAGGGSVGIAGMADVNLVTDHTEATVENSAIGVSNDHVGSVHVTAKHEVNIDSKAGALGVGLSGGGIGAGASVNVLKAKTVASVDNSDIYATGMTEVTADSTKHVDATALTAGVGGTVGIGGAAVVTLIGDAVTGDAEEEVNKGGSGSLSAVDEFTTGDKLSDLPDTGENGPQVFSASEKSDINASSNVSTASVTSASGGYTFRTAAEIKGNSSVDTGTLSVTATDKTDTKSLVGGFGASLGGGIGGGVAVTNVKANVEATVTNTIVTASGDVLVKATADNDQGKSVDMLALAGGAGLVGVGAAVGVADVNNNVTATFDSDMTGASSQLTVSAEDKSDILVDSNGAAVGAGAAGVVVSTATKQSRVAAELGGSATVANAVVSSTDEGMIKATGKSAVGGLVGGLNGVKTEATSSSNVSAETKASTVIDATGGQFTLLAKATPQTSAKAGGVAVAGGGAIGGSLAEAGSSAKVIADVGSNTSIQANNINVGAELSVEPSKPTALAEAYSASGGLLLGVNGSKATAQSSGETKVTVGGDSTLTATDTVDIKGQSNSEQVSSASGISIGGVLATGEVRSDSEAKNINQVELGDEVKVTAGTLNLTAESEDTNYSKVVAGSGGLASAPFSEAKASSDSTTKILIGAGNNSASDARKIAVENLTVKAQQTSNFNSWIVNTNASLFGFSGAKARNDITNNTATVIANNGYIEAENIALNVANFVNKSNPSSKINGLDIDAPTWNVNSGSGGLEDIAAASSFSEIENTATVDIGSGAHIEQDGDREQPGSFTVDAHNNVQAVDKTKMASGGAVSNASAESIINANINNATVKVGDGANVLAIGDIYMGASSDANISSKSAVDVYGLVGVAPYGKALSSFKSENKIDVNSAVIRALRDIKLTAGRSATGDLNDISTRARSDVFNNTAIPASKDPVADAIIKTNSAISIDSGSEVRAARHVMLYAEKGRASASGVGIGKDLYREALAKAASAISNAFGGGDVSFETKTGNSVTNQASSVEVDGDVRVGIQRKQALEINIDGTIKTQTDGITYSAEFKEIAKDILERIQELNELIAEYALDDEGADASIAVKAYESEISFLEKKLDDMGYIADSQGGFYSVASVSPKEVLQDYIARLETIKEAKLEGISVNQASVDALTEEKAGLLENNSNLDIQNSNLTQNINSLEGENETLRVSNETLQIEYEDSGTTAARKSQIRREIDENDATISTNESTIRANQDAITANNSTISTNNSTIRANEDEISALNDDISSDQEGVYDLITELESSNNELATASDEIQGGPVARYLTINDITAQLGNIYVRADDLNGNGTLDAPGDASITVTNNSTTFLKFNELTIPADVGGKVYFNSLSVEDNQDINRGNRNGSSSFDIFTENSQVDSAGNKVVAGKPQILVQSLYDPLSPIYQDGTPDSTAKIAPDLVFTRDVSNPRGLVKVSSEAGSIRLEQNANIRADSVDIKTKNGDFVQSYSDGFFHTAGAPLTIVPGNNELKFPENVDKIKPTPETQGQGIIANGSVLISARYLNVNGIIQSGIPEWGVQIPDKPTVDLGNGNSAASLSDATNHYNALSATEKQVQGAEFYKVSSDTVTNLSGNEQGAWEAIPVYYNAKENRLELNGVQVQGGYIELFGEIINTNASSNPDIAHQIGGKLRVLDGYGQIKVQNDSTTPVHINVLDTGRGAQGAIKVTQLSVDDSNEVVSTTTTYSREPGASRTGQSLSPKADTTYGMMVGYDTSKTHYYRYSKNGWFGIKSAPTKEKYKIKTKNRSNDPLLRGEFIQAGGALGEHKQEKTISKGKVKKTDSWKSCNWWTLCANATYYMEYKQSEGTKTTTTHRIKADNPINIEFIGFDQGRIDIGSSSAAVVINGAINNRSGDVTISAPNLTQSSSIAQITADNVYLDSGNGIGSVAQSIQLNIKDGGLLRAVSNEGEMYLSQATGNMRVDRVGGAAVSKVVLQAERDLLGYNADSFVQAKRVELNSQNGDIAGFDGTSSFKVKTGHSSDMTQWADYGLSAKARGDINIENGLDSANASEYNGNLLLIEADSLAGDVRIQTPGELLDNNPNETTDTRTQTELATLWDSLALRGSAAQQKADDQVASYKRGKEANYQQYWKVRKLQADGGAVYNSGFQFSYTPAQQDALLASGLTSSEITAMAESKTTQYHQLHNEVGSFTTAFDAAYSYDIAGVEADIRRGSEWSDAQLQLSVGAGLLKNITDTVTTIKTANVKGQNINLISGSNIGSFNHNLQIDLNAPLDQLTVQQKSALMAAEEGDTQVNGNIITVAQARPVNVTTGSGVLDASADGFMLIGSESDVGVGNLTATQDIRLKTSGSIVGNSASSIMGNDVILEAAKGQIGSQLNPITVQTAQETPTTWYGITARAKQDVWLNALSDMYVNTMYSEAGINLQANDSIFDNQLNETANNEQRNIHANYVLLSAQNGSIGTSTNALDIGVEKEGLINATTNSSGQGIFINSTKGELANIGSINSAGKVEISAADEVVLEGTVTSAEDTDIKAGTASSGSILGTERAGVDVISGGALSMQAPDMVGGEHAVVAKVAGAVDIQSTEMNVDVASSNYNSPLTVSVSGSANQPVENANLKVSASTVNFQNFNVETAEVNATTENMSVPNGNVTDHAIFNMPKYNTRIDALDRTEHAGYDVNVFTLDGKFDLTAKTYSVSTEPFVLNKNQNLQWIGVVPKDVDSETQSLSQSSTQSTRALGNDSLPSAALNSFFDFQNMFNAGASIVKVGSGALNQMFDSIIRSGIDSSGGSETSGGSGSASTRLDAEDKKKEDEKI